VSDAFAELNKEFMLLKVYRFQVKQREQNLFNLLFKYPRQPPIHRQQLTFGLQRMLIQRPHIHIINNPPHQHIILKIPKVFTSKGHQKFELFTCHHPTYQK